MQLNRVIERSFHFESEPERDAWKTACDSVKESMSTIYLNVLHNHITLSISIAPKPAADEDTGPSRNRAMTYVNGKAKRIEMDINHFEMLKVLGKGTFGKVMLAKQKVCLLTFVDCDGGKELKYLGKQATGDVFAIKILKKSMVMKKP